MSKRHKRTRLTRLEVLDLRADLLNKIPIPWDDANALCAMAIEVIDALETKLAEPIKPATPLGGGL